MRTVMMMLLVLMLAGAVQGGYWQQSGIPTAYYDYDDDDPNVTANSFASASSGGVSVSAYVDVDTAGTSNEESGEAYATASYLVTWEWIGGGTSTGGELTWEAEGDGDLEGRSSIGDAGDPECDDAYTIGNLGMGTDDTYGGGSIETDAYWDMGNGGTHDASASVCCKDASGYGFDYHRHWDECWEDDDTSYENPPYSTADITLIGLEIPAADGDRCSENGSRTITAGTTYFTLSFGVYIDVDASATPDDCTSLANIEGQAYIDFSFDFDENE